MTTEVTQNAEFNLPNATQAIALIKEFLNSPLSSNIGFINFIKEADTSTATEDAAKMFKDASAFFDSCKGQKGGRLYIDGCFDMMHSGHFNAIRKSKLLCRELVVGVNSDADIINFKGPPIMNGEERASMVRACKWVDEVQMDTAYVPDLALIDKFNCQYVGHGDDIIVGADGKSIYSPFIDQGRMR